jgi:hypothetical protein
VSVRAALVAVAVLVAACGDGAEPEARPTTATAPPGAPPLAIAYARDGGRIAPPDHEVLRIDGDRFEMWRSHGSTKVGSFAGPLPAGAGARLASEAAAAAGAGPLTGTPLPDGAVESVTVGGVSATVGEHDRPEGPWGVLVVDLRRLLAELTASPRAALALEVTPPAGSARLVHLGADPLRIDASMLRVRTVLWGPGSEKLGDWTSPPTDSGESSIGPGWTLALPFGHGFSPGAGQVVHTYVTLSAFEGPAPIQVELSDLPPVPP